MKTPQVPSIARIPVRPTASALALAAFACLSLSEARAAVKDDNRTLTLEGGASWVTHKSKLTQSNDTGLSYDLGLRVLGGGEGTILVDGRASQSSVSFTLNSTSLSRQELACFFGWNFGFGYVGVGAGTRQFTATLGADSKLETFSRTYGGILGIDFELFRGAALFLDATGMTPFDTKETNQQDVTMGLGLDARAGTVFDITRRSLDLGLGVRYATLAVSSAGRGGGETMTAPFLFLRWGIDP